MRTFLFLSSLLSFASVQAAEPDPTVVTAMEKFLGNEVAGVVTLVGNKDGTTHLAAQGWANVEEEERMTKDHLFWIASMTKPVTGAAVMMMVEEGKVKLDDPVSKHLPEFKNLKNKEGEAREVTVLQCLTHTAGLSELGREEGGMNKLAEVTAAVVEKPLQFEPGSQWRYSQTSINTAARIVEVASGMEFPEFLEKRIFGPLGMEDTTFYPSKEQQERLATSYRRTDGGTLEATDIHFLRGRPLEDPSRLPRANGGLFSTAEDYGRFCRMLLREGELDGTSLLKPESVKTLRSIHTGDIQVGFTPGNGWGVGCCVVREPQGVTRSLSPGTYGHGGAFGTQAWIDPVAGNYQLLFVQRANFPNSDGSPVRQALHDAVKGN